LWARASASGSADETAQAAAFAAALAAAWLHGHAADLALARDPQRASLHAAELIESMRRAAVAPVAG
jgi:NAD(P)H-hydrate repair Nnr-like enzyme with NAD(P)H-hydrate dehydratase domain